MYVRDYQTKFDKQYILTQQIHLMYVIYVA